DGASLALALSDPSLRGSKGLRPFEIPAGAGQGAVSGGPGDIWSGQGVACGRRGDIYEGPRPLEILGGRGQGAGVGGREAVWRRRVLSLVGEGISGWARESPAVGGGISKGAVGPLRAPEGYVWAERSDRP